MAVIVLMKDEYLARTAVAGEVGPRRLTSLARPQFTDGPHSTTSTKQGVMLTGHSVLCALGLATARTIGPRATSSLGRLLFRLRE